MDESSRRRIAGGTTLRRAAPAAVAIAVVATLGACGTPPTPAFDLSAPRTSGGRGSALVVVEPAALQPFESERIAVRDAAGSYSLLPGGQWADRLPRLVQTRLIQTFENGGQGRGVGRPGDGITPDRQLNTDLRAFQFDARTGEAVVEISAKVIDSKSGQVMAARVFSARNPVGAARAAEIVQALDRSSSSVLAQIVRWSSGARGLSDPSGSTLRR